MKKVSVREDCSLSNCLIQKRKDTILQLFISVYGHGNIEQMRGGEREEEADGKQEIIMSQDIHF